MAEDMKPASWVGDSVEEFKKLPTWGKIAIGVVFVGVLVFAYIQYKNAASSASTTAAATTTGTSASTLLGSANNPTLPPTNYTGSGDTSIPSGPGSTPTVPSSPTTPTGPVMTGQPVTSPIKITQPAPAPVQAPSAPKLQTYTVQSGDTLSGIASKLKVNGGWQTLYNANKPTVDRTAQAHGFYQNDQNWIFPGEKLVVPQG